jgi:uncharacterized membrane protein YfcA
LLADTNFLLAAIPAVLLVGLAKGGFAGALGMLGTPIMALAIPPVQAAAILLPVLIVMDVIAVTSWRSHIKWSVIRAMLPGALAGIAIGWGTAAWVSDNLVRLIVGAIAITFALMQFAAELRSAPPRPENRARAAFWGTFSGFTSFVAHAGGPPFHAYALPLRLDKEILVGTNVVFFFIVNVVKLAPYFALGQFGTENLRTSALLTPVAIAGVIFGIWLVRRVSQRLFYNITYAALFVIGAKLVYDSVPALLAVAG